MKNEEQSLSSLGYGGIGAASGAVVIGAGALACCWMTPFAMSFFGVVVPGVGTIHAPAAAGGVAAILQTTATTLATKSAVVVGATVGGVSGATSTNFKQTVDITGKEIYSWSKSMYAWTERNFTPRQSIQLPHCNQIKQIGDSYYNYVTANTWSNWYQHKHDLSPYFSWWFPVTAKPVKE